MYLESCPLLTFTESVIPRPTDVTINALFHVKANSFSANKNSSILLKNKPPSNPTIGIQTTRFSPEIDRRLVRNIKWNNELFELPAIFSDKRIWQIPLYFSKALFDNPFTLQSLLCTFQIIKKTLKLNKIKNKFSITLDIHILRLILLTILVLLCPGRTSFYSPYFSPILFHYSTTVSMRSLYLPRKGKHFIKKLFKHFQRNILDYLSIAAAES